MQAWMYKQNNCNLPNESSKKAVLKWTQQTCLHLNLHTLPFGFPCSSTKISTSSSVSRTFCWKSSLCCVFDLNCSQFKFGPDMAQTKLKKTWKWHNLLNFRAWSLQRFDPVFWLAVLFISKLPWYKLRYKIFVLCWKYILKVAFKIICGYIQPRNPLST